VSTIENTCVPSCVGKSMYCGCLCKNYSKVWSKRSTPRLTCSQSFKRCCLRSVRRAFICFCSWWWNKNSQHLVEGLEDQHIGVHNKKLKKNKYKKGVDGKEGEKLPLMLDLEAVH